MKKIVFVLILTLIIALTTGCGQNERYIQLFQENGRTTYIDKESVTYDKETKVATYWAKQDFDEKARINAASKWADNGGVGANPYLETQYILSLHKVRLDSKYICFVELNYMDKNGKAVLRIPAPVSNNWVAFNSDDKADKAQQAVLKIIKDQGKL